MVVNFESALQIGQKVSVDIGNQPSIVGYVRAVTFARSKVRYAVQVYAGLDITTLHNIDSSYVNAVEPPEFMDMPEDNYS